MWAGDGAACQPCSRQSANEVGRLGGWGLGVNSRWSAEAVLPILAPKSPGNSRLPIAVIADFTNYLILNMSRVFCTF